MIPTLGVRLARATFEPDLLISDGEALPRRERPSARLATRKGVEGWLPFRTVFDLVWSRPAARDDGRDADRSLRQPEHLGASATGRTPEGAADRRRAARRATRSTTRRATGSRTTAPATFVEKVDFVSGVGNDRAAARGFHELRRVVTNLGVFDFETPDGAMRAALAPSRRDASTRCCANTGFELVVPDDVAGDRAPDRGGAAADPRGARSRRPAQDRGHAVTHPAAAHARSASCSAWSTRSSRRGWAGSPARRSSRRRPTPAASGSSARRPWTSTSCARRSRR